MTDQARPRRTPTGHPNGLASNSTEPRSRMSRGPQTRLIRMLAHDLKNPISGILAASQCLLEDTALFLDAQQQALLRSIEFSSELMLQLIEDMVVVAQAGSDDLKPRFRAADLLELVEQSAAIYRPKAEAKNTRLEVRRHGVVPHLDLEPQKMLRALNALLASMVRCSPSGGEIELKISAQRKSVVITVRHLGSEDPFTHRAFSSRSSKQGGAKPSALTLSAVRLIVKAQGGGIRVQKGALCPSYQLTLPRPSREVKLTDPGERGRASASGASSNP